MWTAGRCALSLFAVALVAVHQGDSSQGVAARGAPLRFPAGLHRQPLAVRGGAAAKPKKKKAKKAPAEKDEAEADDVTYQLHKVKIAEDANLDASTVTVLASALAAMGLEDGDVVRVHGARRSATLAKVRAGEGPAAASSDVYGNAKRPSFVWLTKVANLSPASGVELALVTPRDSLPAGVDDAALLDGCVVPYFKNEDRPLVVGDVFSASYTAEDESIVADDLEIRWKVVALVLGSGASVEEAFCASESDIHLAAEEAFEDETTAPPRTYADLGGLQPQIELLKEVLELPLQQPYVFSAIGVPPPRGVLVTGPPGCGKSLLARAAAYESGAHVEFISGSEIVGKKAGEAEEALRAKFASAEANAPSIVVIDDLDAVGKKRAKASETEKRVCSQLLTLLDGLRPTSGVIVLGATSKPNDLDPALRRFGRLDREVEIVVPDASARLEILQVLTKSMRLAEDVALERIAGEAHGFVGADLAQLCTEAALATVRDGLAGAAVAVGADDGASYWENSNGDENLVFDALTAQLALEDAASPELSVLAVKQAHFLSALKSCNPSSLRESIVEVPDVSWADVGGLEDVKRDLKETVEYPIQFAHHYEAYGLPPSKGVLFYGPPGCGKTLIARQIGKVLNAREPKIVNGPEVLDKYVGASEQKIRDLFADAEKEQKDRGDDSMLHIIIFDEMDAICKSRGSVKDGTGVSDSIVNQLLSKIDGVDSLNNILIIGMTNRKDMIDEAILRPGRLELHVEIGLPDEAGRLQILKIKTAAMRESGRLEAAAADALPYFAAKTKNFSGAELEGLVKSAASYALRRCCDVSKDMTLDEASLVIKKADLDYAIESGDVVPRLGVQLEDLELLYRNGIVDYGPAFADMKASLDRLVDQVRTSPRTPLMTVLLEGAAATGKTALAAATAVASQFPFIRILAADSMIGYSESSKCTTIQKFFLDSYKSPLSILVIDDIERLIEYTPIGPRFSNPVLQTLLVLLKKAPPEADRRLMVIATTGSARSLEDLELVEAFNVSIHVPKLSAPAEIQAVLRELAVADADVAQISAAVTKPMGVKQLLMITEMARGENDAVNVNDFMDCLHTVIH
mmetsp:Transcript_22049/g.78557  ORF Transcript_22049/g.78557 Transcript_22049/m.78557 type:complete len:1089 (+) Transcript_22049:147-3413(+)